MTYLFNPETSIITIDGPSGAGKGTVCMQLAQKLGWHLLDSGAIYRVLALAALQRHISLSDETMLAQLALDLNVEFRPEGLLVQVFLDHKPVSELLRQEETGYAASQIAAFPFVRNALLARQRAFVKAPGLIADGRDMGTVVFPNALVKIFLEASAPERAKRRLKQLQEQGICANLGEILQQIEERDHRDRNRTVAPLRPAQDALIIDSTNLSIEQVLQEIHLFAETKHIYSA